MPHVTLHALEGDLAGREPGLIGELTDAVVSVYGGKVIGDGGAHRR